MTSYVGLFLSCFLLSPCQNLPPKHFPSMQACLNEAYDNRLAVCRKFKGKKFVGYVAVSLTQGSSRYGNTK